MLFNLSRFKKIQKFSVCDYFKYSEKKFSMFRLCYVNKVIQNTNYQSFEKTNINLMISVDNEDDVMFLLLLK